MTDDEIAEAIAVLEAQRAALTVAIDVLCSRLGESGAEKGRLRSPTPAVPPELARLLQQVPQRHVASDVVRYLLNEAPRDWSIPELLQACRDRGYHLPGLNEKNLASVLSRDVRDKRAVRTTRGRYLAVRHCPG